ncbi:Riboflavin transport system permease protein RibX [Methylobacterium crusticola]|uniref:Riboflavin transport system permease protein RibX n=1 Tax=Methylobacterium crusticola TaxID=1697972 RepID=A0ABQ4QVI1_9HYPH|nr:ABC transporter permease [Methylobacterium crusticola]GJD48666.1 Riboflavin transport system permease protein RibX [Methylobacterium crusticola]
MAPEARNQGAGAARPGGWRTIVDRTLLFVAALAGWHVLSGRVVDPFWISSPGLVAERLWRLALNGDLAWHAGATVWQALLGLGLGLCAGFAIGLLLGRSPRLAAAVDPYLMGLYSLPRIALAPLFILWFGIGLGSKVMMVFSFVVFIVILNTMQGLREVDRDLVDLMRSMRASPSYIARRVQLPSMLPWLFAAARISVGLALIGSVLGELLGANRGLGWYVEHSGGRLDTTGVFAGLAALMAIAVAMNQAVNLLERWLCPAR